MTKRSIIAVLLAATVVAIAVPAAGAVLLPPAPGPPWELKIKASGHVEVAWETTAGKVREACEDWYREKGSETVLASAPTKARPGQLISGTIYGGGRTRVVLDRGLIAEAGSSSAPGCPGVCPPGVGGASLAYRAPPVAHAADCILPDEPTPPDVSGCSPSQRDLRGARFDLTGSSKSDRPFVKVRLGGTLRKPWVRCPNPPVAALSQATEIRVEVPLLRRLKRGGMVFGDDKGKRSCEGYPKLQGGRRTKCTVEWRVKVSIFRAR